MADRWLSVREAAERVKRSPVTIRRWIREEEITAVVGRVRESKLIEVDRAMRQRAKRCARRVQIELKLGGRVVGQIALNPTNGAIEGRIHLEDVRAVASQSKAAITLTE